MRRRFRMWILLWILLSSYAPLAHPVQAQSADGVPNEQRVPLRGGPMLSAAGPFVSAETAAPEPFSHLMLRWEAGIPAGSALTLEVRASTDQQDWTRWQALVVEDSLWMEQDGPDTYWSDVVDVGQMARFWQVRAITRAAPTGEQPQLRMVSVNTVDAATGPATPQPERAPTLSAAVDKPAVVSRTDWKSPDGQGSRVKPAYYPVNHITVHHTADSGTLSGNEANWASRVRAYWSFHAITRGWGDIGYNYLIDPNGIIYEGRAGGDDAVGFHDTANYGSMGISVIGTYTSSAPTPASQDALVRLMAWKSSQKRIDPLGKSYYYGCAVSKYCYPFNEGAVVPNIAGHRQVTPGHTTCPGDAFMALMPGLRNRVRQMMSATPTQGDNGDLQVDELESSFARSAATWYEATCGAGGHTYYTYATDSASESSNSATWRPRIPATGQYRVFAHVPQGCGLGSPPYASTKAAYRIHSASGDAVKVIDQNTASEWVDLGLYTFAAGTDGAIELSDLTGEAYSQRKVVFFDAIKWVAEDAGTSAELVNVQFAQQRIAAGELLKIQFTVRNNGTSTISGQSPRVDQTASEQLGAVENGYVYDQDECFLGNAQGTYPAHPKETDRFRVTLGMNGWDGTPTRSCVGGTGDAPWRWGINGELAPGQSQTLIGYVRFRTPGTYTLQAGLIQEYNRYFAQNVFAQTVTVTPEQLAPEATAYDGQLAPMAHVYQLGRIPDNFLARTRNALSIAKGTYIGSFAWDGTKLDWGAGGPLGQTDGFVVEQTRIFYAPADGTYTFHTTSDDGSWLWVDGWQVVSNYGIHEEIDISGEIDLKAGPHVVAFKYFDRTGGASAGYTVALPDTAEPVSLPNEMDRMARFGARLASTTGLIIGADDFGGTGVDRIRWQVNDGPWQEQNGALLTVGTLPDGAYTLRYQAVDRAGTASAERTIALAVDPAMQKYRIMLPYIGR